MGVARSTGQIPPQNANPSRIQDRPARYQLARRSGIAGELRLKTGRLILQPLTPKLRARLRNGSVRFRLADKRRAATVRPRFETGCV